MFVFYLSTQNWNPILHIRNATILTLGPIVSIFICNHECKQIYRYTETYTTKSRRLKSIITHAKVPIFHLCDYFGSRYKTSHSWEIGIFAQFLHSMLLFWYIFILQLLTLYLSCRYADLQSPTCNRSRVSKISCSMIFYNVLSFVVSVANVSGISKVSISSIFNHKDILIILHLHFQIVHILG